MEDCLEYAPTVEDRVGVGTRAEPLPEPSRPSEALVGTTPTLACSGGDVPDLLAYLSEPTGEEEASVDFTTPPTRPRVVCGNSLLAAQLSSSVAPPELDFKQQTGALPTPRDAPDANEHAMFVDAGPDVEQAPGAVQRVGEWMASAMRSIGVAGRSGCVDTKRERVRLYSGDLYIPAAQRMAYDTLVAGGDDLQTKLIAGNVTMDMIVACGVDIQEWYNVGLDLKAVAALRGGWGHLVSMGLSPGHVFGRQTKQIAFDVLCAEPFSMDWNKMSRSWGITFDELVRKHVVTTAQLGRLGVTMQSLLGALSATREHVALLGEPEVNYRLNLGASDAQIAALFQKPVPARGHADTGAEQPRPRAGRRRGGARTPTPGRRDRCLCRVHAARLSSDVCLERPPLHEVFVRVVVARVSHVLTRCRACVRQCSPFSIKSAG